MGKIETATQWMIDLANDDSHGYDQDSRWGPDYDCSSSVISAWQYAGVPVKSQRCFFHIRYEKCIPFLWIHERNFFRKC